MAALALSAPVPTLDAPGAPASLERALTVAMAAVSFPDGAPLGQPQAGKAGVFLYRTAVSGGAEEIWNEGAQRWQAPPADLAPLQPTPFNFKAGQPQPWQAMVVAAGQKDAAGAMRFDKASGGFPRYRARAYLEATQDGIKHAGISAASADWTFASEADQARFKIDLFGQQAKTATRARLVIKNPNLSDAAYIEVHADSGNEVEIVRCDAAGAALASIVIAGNGDIRLKPAGKVVIDGNLEVNEVSYLPSNGGGRRSL
jgi:hypothetical protein